MSWSGRRPMTPDEARYAEDRIVMDMVGIHGPATLDHLAGGLDYDSCTTPDGRASLMIVWPEDDGERRAYLRSILTRLLAAKRVRLVSRRWASSASSRSRRA